MTLWDLKIDQKKRVSLVRIQKPVAPHVYMNNMQDVYILISIYSYLYKGYICQL